MPALRLSHKLFLAFALIDRGGAVARRLEPPHDEAARRREPHHHPSGAARRAPGSHAPRRRGRPPAPGGALRAAPRSGVRPAVRRARPGDRGRARDAGHAGVDAGGAPDPGRGRPAARSASKRSPSARTGGAVGLGAGGRTARERWSSGSTGTPAPSCAGEEPWPRRWTSRVVWWRSSPSGPASRWRSPSPGSRARRIARPLRELRRRGAGGRAAQALRAHSGARERRDRRPDHRLQPDGDAAPGAGHARSSTSSRRSPTISGRRSRSSPGRPTGSRRARPACSASDRPRSSRTSG